MAQEGGGVSGRIDIRVGDARDVLPTIEADSVHCVVTSPPYWGLRDYRRGRAVARLGWAGL